MLCRSYPIFDGQQLFSFGRAMVLIYAHRGKQRRSRIHPRSRMQVVLTRDVSRRPSRLKFMTVSSYTGAPLYSSEGTVCGLLSLSAVVAPNVLQLFVLVGRVNGRGTLRASCLLSAGCVHRTSARGAVRPAARSFSVCEFVVFACCLVGLHVSY